MNSTFPLQNDMLFPIDNTPTFVSERFVTFFKSNVLLLSSITSYLTKV